MRDISKLYQKRNVDSMRLINDAFDFKTQKDVPFMFNTCNYFSFGYRPEEIPDDYYTNPASMLNHQLEQFDRHYDLIEDNYVPYLMPWYGCGVTASAFGVPIRFLEKMDPSQEYVVEKAVIDEPSDIDKLQVPDPRKDGLMPLVLDTIKYFMEHSDLPIGFTDNHCPLTIAVQVLGYDKLFYWMVDYPDKIHRMMDIFAETVITWVSAQKKLMGHAYNYCIGNQGIPVAEGVGVWMSDDDSVIISEQLYKEFVVPYNDKILKHFGGGIIHYCGNASHLLDCFCSMKYLRGINNFALGEWQNVLKAKTAFEKKGIAYIACDFTPLDPESYYNKLFKEHGMSKQGLVVQSLFAPTTGVQDGKYELCDRDEKTVAPIIENIMRAHFRG